MAVKDWSTTAGSNVGILAGITLDGSVLNVPLIDDSFREMAAQVAAQLGKIGYQGSDIPSAATVNLALATGWYVDVTGTTTITGLGTVDAGQVFILRFASSLTFTHNASTLILPGAANVLTTGGDVAIMMSLGGGAWRCLNYMAGNASAGGGVPTGTVVDYGGAAAPSGWLLCYGQAISRATYAALFAAISTTYGVGDGSTTFNLPDLRGRVTAGQDDMGGTSANRLTGVTGSVVGNTMGASGGAETHTLTTAELVAHTHTFSATTSSNGSHDHNLQTSYLGTWNGANNDAPGAGSGASFRSAYTTSEGAHTHTVSGTTSSVGSNSAHNNVQPTTIMNKIIKT